MIVDVDGSRIDIKHRVAIFLQQLSELGGNANTRDIARRSGLRGWEIREASQQAQDRGLVEFVGYDDASFGPGDDPRLYELTGHGRQVVSRGVPEKVITLNEPPNSDLPEDEYKKLHEKVIRLERCVDALQMGDTAEQFEDLRRRDNAATCSNGTQNTVTRDEFYEFEEYVYEWMDTAESLILAVTEVLEERGIEIEERRES